MKFGFVIKITNALGLKESIRAMYSISHEYTHIAFQIVL